MCFQIFSPLIKNFILQGWILKLTSNEEVKLVSSFFPKYTMKVITFESFNPKPSWQSLEILISRKVKLTGSVSSEWVIPLAISGGSVGWGRL